MRITARITHHTSVRGGGAGRTSVSPPPPRPLTAPYPPTHQPPPSGLPSFSWQINRALFDPEAGLEYGVQAGDGDGTVPLISLGLMAAPGWQVRP